jgi:DNA polymerase-1
MLLIIDSNNLWMRAWHATRNEAMTADGESTAALVVYANTLVRHIRNEKPDRVVVCWDGGGSAYRLRLLPSYKANRTSIAGVEATHYRASRRQIREFLALAGIFQVERTGVEADDLVAKYWYEAEEPIVLVSEDKDFLQLAGDNPQGHRCEILRATGERWSANRVKQYTGSMPRHLPSVMALTGDDSDNIPGVPGIGPKRAVALLDEAGWNLEAIEHSEVSQRRQQVLLNRVLVNLRAPVPGLVLPKPPPFRPTGPGSALYTEFVDYLERYRLKGLLAKLYSGSLWTEEEQFRRDVISSDTA